MCTHELMWTHVVTHVGQDRLQRSWLPQNSGWQSLNPSWQSQLPNTSWSILVYFCVWNAIYICIYIYIDVFYPRLIEKHFISCEQLTQINNVTSLYGPYGVLTACGQGCVLRRKLLSWPHRQATVYDGRVSFSLCFSCIKVSITTPRPPLLTMNDIYIYI